MPQDRGIIQLLIILVLAVVIISLLGVKLGEVFQNKVLQDNFSFVFRAAKFVWENYLARPAKIIVRTFAELILQTSQVSTKGCQMSPGKVRTIIFAGRAR